MKKHEDHICRFNDGDCICECYEEGFSAGEKEVKDRIIEWAKNYMNEMRKHYGTDKHGISEDDLVNFLNKDK